MSPLLIFGLVVLFLLGGLLVLRDTAFLRGKQTPDTNTHRRAHRDQPNQGAVAAPMLLSADSARPVGDDLADHGSSDSCGGSSSDGGGSCD